MQGNFQTWFARHVSITLSGIAALTLVALHSPVEAASPSSELKKMMSKVDRQLCRSLSFATCKRRMGQKKTKLKSGNRGSEVKSKPPTTARQVKLKPTTGVFAEDKKSTDRKPDPEPKVTSNKDIAPAPTLEKGRVPIPTLKPTSLSREAMAPKIPSAVETKIVPENLPETKVVILPAPKLPTPQPFPPATHGMPDGTPVGEACYDSLRRLGVQFKQLTANVGTGACFVADAVEIQSITIGDHVLKLSDRPTLNCGFAAKFGSWIKDEAVPAVKTATNKNIATLGTGPGFQCRGRNGDSSAKLSEHAFGNAVDIERIKLTDGEIIDVKDALSIGSKFQPVLAVLRATSCQYFTTVLGPGANAAHESHFHFDLARRGKKGNHTMCQ